MTTLQTVMDDQRAFAIERNWGQFHSPKNLAMALGGEFGELAVAVADAVSSSEAGVELADLDSVTSEIADVTLYLLRLFDVLRCPLPGDREPDTQPRPGMDLKVFDSLARLAGSIGSILEVWQWSDSDVNPQRSVETATRLGAALEDLESFAEIVGVSLASVASDKLARNAARYPVDKSFGSSAKYRQLE